MRSLRVQIKLTIILGFVALIVGVLTHLALTDIYHGETDVGLEWAIVRAGALFFFVFAATALFTLGRVLKTVQ